MVKTGKEYLRAGDMAYTPRFCTVTVKEVFDSRNAAESAGYTEQTYYEDGSYGILGKSLDLYHMEFAAYKKQEGKWGNILIKKGI